MSVDRLHRAAWVSTELLLTFPPPALTAVTVIPLNSDDTTGRFRVWLEAGDGSPILMWDRKVNGGFPELKVLVSRMTTAYDVVFTLAQKQRIRDHIQPGKSLGHSDRKS